MSVYKMNFDSSTSILTVAFGDPATNDQIVKYVNDNAPDISGIKVLKINGPASLPVAINIAHKYVHTVGAIAVFDPKLGKYVVAVSHDPDYKIGDLID